MVLSSNILLDWKYQCQKTVVRDTIVFLSMSIDYHSTWKERTKQTYSEESVKVHWYLYTSLPCLEYTQHESLAAKIDTYEKTEWKFNCIEKIVAVWCSIISIFISIWFHIPAWSILGKVCLKEYFQKRKKKKCFSKIVKLFLDSCVEGYVNNLHLASLDSYRSSAASNIHFNN